MPIYAERLSKVVVFQGCFGMFQTEYHRICFQKLLRGLTRIAIQKHPFEQILSTDIHVCNDIWILKEDCSLETSGAILQVEKCVEAQIPVIPIPGPSAVITALVASGLPTYEFTFGKASYLQEIH